MRKTDAFASLWGDVIAAEGFTMVPKALTTRYRDLGLDREDVALIQALLSHWWMSDQAPFPSLDRLVQLSGLSKSTVCRRLDKLEALRLIKSRPCGARTQRSLAGLVDGLEEVLHLEPYSSNLPKPQ